jgi:hypothetical protein
MRAVTLLALSACAQLEPEDPSGWFDEGDPYEVAEPVLFTDEPYGLPAGGAPGIADQLEGAFSFPRGFGTRIAAADQTTTTCSNWIYDEELPVDITGVVTILPKYYFKSDGCTSDDEKFYGSYFLEDDTGGVFVLGDTRISRFDAGDTVTIRVRGARRSFDQDMIYVHDVLEVDRTARPISYEVRQAPFGAGDVGQVRRITGTVASLPDTFGEFYLQPDDAAGTCNAATGSGCAVISLDVELNRRGVAFAPGERVMFTGPILYAYSTYKLIVMRLGQLERL